MSADLKVICHGCMVINRVPRNRLNNAPKCGKCHKPLFGGDILELTDGNFQKLISGGSLPLLVLFWAPWCGYCQKTLPDFNKASARLEPDLKLATLNSEANPVSSSRYSVNSLPTLVLFKDGKEIARQPGAMSEAQVVAWARAKLT